MQKTLIPFKYFTFYLFQGMYYFFTVIYCTQVTSILAKVEDLRFFQRITGSQTTL